MANASNIFGLRPSRYRNGSKYNGQVSAYAFSASDASAAYKGDVVKVDTTNRSTALTDAFIPGVPVLTAYTGAITTGTVRGIIAGFVPEPEFNMTTSASLGLMYRKASTARYVWVVDDQDVVFEVEEAGNSYTSSSSNAINKTQDITYTAGSTLTGISGVTLTGTAGASLAFRCLRYTQKVDNFGFTASDASSHAHWDVLNNLSDMLSANAGA